MFAHQVSPSAMSHHIFDPTLLSSVPGSNLPNEEVYFSWGGRSRKQTAYAIGIELWGLVSGISIHGLFIRLPNGESGLVFKNSVCWPGEHFEYAVGERVRVKIVGFKVDRGLALSIRETRKSASFKTFSEQFPVCSKITGTIKRVIGYGLFVTVAPGVVGLVHESLIQDFSMYGKWSVGQPIDVRVMQIEHAPNRLQLSLD